MPHWISAWGNLSAQQKMKQYTLLEMHSQMQTQDILPIQVKYKYDSKAHAMLGTMPLTSKMALNVRQNVAKSGFVYDIVIINLVFNSNTEKFV